MTPHDPQTRIVATEPAQQILNVVREHDDLLCRCLTHRECLANQLSDVRHILAHVVLAEVARLQAENTALRADFIAEAALADSRGENLEQQRARAEAAEAARDEARRSVIAPTTLTAAAHILRTCADHIQSLSIGYGAEQMKAIASELGTGSAEMLKHWLAADDARYSAQLSEVALRVALIEARAILHAWCQDEDDNDAIPPIAAAFDVMTKALQD